MQRLNEGHTTARRKVCAALLAAGETIGTIAKKHGLKQDLLSISLTRYLTGRHALPRTPKLFDALREMEELSDVVIMRGAHSGESKQQGGGNE